MNQDQEPARETGTNSFLKVIIWVVLLAIVVAAGYFVYSKYFKNLAQNSEFTQEERDLCKKQGADFKKFAETHNQKPENYEQICLDALLEAKHKTAEAKIKAGLSTLRSLAQNYYGEKSTYKGYDSRADTQTVINDIASKGSKVNQNVTDNTFLVYALLPYSKTTYCIDINNAGSYAGEVQSISPSQTSCK